MVTSGLLASQLEAFHLQLIDEIHFAFSQSVQQVCKATFASMSLIQALLLGDPTIALRKLLKNEFIVAKSGNGFVEVYPCSPFTKGLLPIAATIPSTLY